MRVGLESKSRPLIGKANIREERGISRKVPVSERLNYDILMIKKERPKNGSKNEGLLHPKAKTVLIEKLVSDFTKCRLQNGSLVFEGMPPQWGLEFAKEAKKQRDPYLDLGSAWSILINHVRETFDDLPLKERPSGDLAEIIGEKGKMALAERIVDFVESVPRSYTFYLRLFHHEIDKGLNCPLGKDLELVNVNEGHPLLKVEKTWTDSEFIAAVKRKKHPDSAGAFVRGNQLLKIQSKGYAETGLNRSAAVVAVSRLKQVIYLGTLLGIFEEVSKFSPWGGKLSAELYVCDDNSKKNRADKISLPSELAEYLAGIRIGKGFAKDILYAKVAMPLWRLFDLDEDEEDRAPISTAAEWAFDSAASGNQTVSFIQLCIALEAVLGDSKTKDGVTRALADRCAYLLGKTTRERNVIREKFEALYELRSYIVHGRKVRLAHDELDLLNWGRKVLDMILYRELLNVEFSRRPKGGGAAKGHAGSETV